MFFTVFLFLIGDGQVIFLPRLFLSKFLIEGLGNRGEGGSDRQSRTPLALLPLGVLLFQ